MKQFDLAVQFFFIDNIKFFRNFIRYGSKVKHTTISHMLYIMWKICSGRLFIYFSLYFAAEGKYF